jgi:hypothetical protein
MARFVANYVLRLNLYVLTIDIGKSRYYSYNMVIYHIRFLDQNRSLILYVLRNNIFTHTNISVHNNIKCHNKIIIIT